MSQSTLFDRAETSSSPLSALPAQREMSEFDYRPVPMLASISLFLGIASFLALLGLFGLVVALVGMLIGALTLLRIRLARGVLGGQALAGVGLALSVVFFCTGAWFQYSDYVSELPPGYERVNFPREIAEKKFVYALDEESQTMRRELHPDVERFEDQKIFVKGYMWQTKRIHGLDEFILLKDNGECCFGGDPAAHDMMLVRMQEGQTVDYMGGMIAVAGILRCYPEAGEGEPVYVLEAFHCDRARTSF